MFEIIYNKNKYILKAALKINCQDYLVLCMDEMDNFIFIHSKDVFELKENSHILEEVAVNLSKDEVYNIRQGELKKKNIIDFENIKLSALNFRELLSIYKKFEHSQDPSSIIFRTRIMSNMKKNLYDCKNNGKIDYNDDVKELIKNSYEVNLENIIDYELKEILIEYTNFLKVKIYEKMNIYELLKEHSRFMNVLKGKMDIDKLGFPNVDIFTLKEVIEPAVRTLIYLKEEIILTEVLNMSRHALEKNPFTITRKDLENLNLEFNFSEDARFDYNYMYYESLGINTDILYNELYHLNKWEFEEVSRHLLDISKEAIRKYKNENSFKKIMEESLVIYEDIKFVKYFIKHLWTILEVD